MDKKEQVVKKKETQVREGMKRTGLFTFSSFCQISSSRSPANKLKLLQPSSYLASKP